MKVKRILALTVSAFMLLAFLAACGGNGDTADPTPAPATIAPLPDVTPAPVGDQDQDSAIDADTDEYERDYTLSGTLKVWYDNDERFVSMQERFNELYPNITIEYQRISHTDSRAKVQLDGPAGVGPDVFFMPHDHIVNAIMDGLIEPIDARLQKKLENNNVETTVKTVMSGGLMYAVPVCMENIALFYNKDLWGETPPTTMEEIIEWAQGYNDPASGKWAMGWQIDDAYHNYHWLSAHGMSVFGPNNDDYRNPGFDTPEAIAGNEWMLYMRENLFDVPSAEGNWDTTVSAFQNGQLPLTISGPWAIADAKKNGVNFGITKIPTVKGKQPICFSGVRTAAISSYTEVPDLALAFIDFLTSNEGAMYFYEVEGMLPCIKDVSTVPGLGDDELLMGITEQTPFSIPMPTIPEIQAMWDGLKHTFLYVWDKQLTPEEGADKGMETYRINIQAMGHEIDF